MLSPRSSRRRLSRPALLVALLAVVALAAGCSLSDPPKKRAAGSAPSEAAPAEAAAASEAAPAEAVTAREAAPPVENAAGAAPRMQPVERRALTRIQPNRIRPLGSVQTQRPLRTIERSHVVVPDLRGNAAEAAPVVPTRRVLVRQPVAQPPATE